MTSVRLSELGRVSTTPWSSLPPVLLRLRSTAMVWLSQASAARLHTRVSSVFRPAALDTEKSPSKPSVRIAVESRWESSALSMKRDRSPAEAPAPRNAVPRERSPPRDQ